MEKKDLAQELLHLRSRMEKSAMDEDAKERELLRFAGENMDAAQQKKLHDVLQDRQSLQRLLQSESARALLDKLRGGK